ncbi:MAG TPA: anthrax toxin-like adenylyl cyclase domain-containing protein [Gemmatimonadaceae bacterium]|jgi:hypothetical protein
MLTHDTMMACELSGMPLLHAGCFQRVADETGCVISSRSVGIYATGLLLESYATKGFHVKAKSCNWGPMSGFVLSDPRFTKRGISPDARDAQRRDVHSAIVAEHAGETPVYISDERRREVERRRWMTRAGGTINEMQYTAVPPGPPGQQPMRFVLRRMLDGVPGARGKQMWGVFYGASETALPSAPNAPNKPGAQGTLLPVMAMVDPHCPGGVRETFRAAMTGDYDLWAVFPRASRVQPRGIDQRAVPGSERFVLPLGDFARHGDPDLGNITTRVREVKNRLNMALRAAGYAGGDAVHHGDEVGRPKVTEVELEVIAFVPGDRNAYFIKTLGDLKDLFRVVIRDYSITLNPGWQRQLGFAATPAGNWEA